MQNQLSMFDVPPPFNDKPLTKIPDKFWANETYESSEGRDFLKLITEVDPEKIDRNYAPWEITSWLLEMGYEWNGASWVPNGDGDYE